MQMFRSNKKVALIFLISLKLFYDEVILYFSRKIVETFNNLKAILFLSTRFFKQCIFYNSDSLLLIFSNELSLNYCLTVIWVGGGAGRNSPPPCWFSFKNSETVKAVTLAFCSIQ